MIPAEKSASPVIWDVCSVGRSRISCPVKMSHIRITLSRPPLNRVVSSGKSRMLHTKLVCPVLFSIYTGEGLKAGRTVFLAKTPELDGAICTSRYQCHTVSAAGKAQDIVHVTSKVLNNLSLF